jgi:hypothetical protein
MSTNEAATILFSTIGPLVRLECALSLK